MSSCNVGAAIATLFGFVYIFYGGTSWAEINNWISESGAGGGRMWRRRFEKEQSVRPRRTSSAGAKKSSFKM